MIYNDASLEEVVESKWRESMGSIAPIAAKTTNECRACDAIDATRGMEQGKQPNLTDEGVKSLKKGRMWLRRRKRMR